MTRYTYKVVVTGCSACFGTFREKSLEQAEEIVKLLESMKDSTCTATYRIEEIK